MKRNRKLAGSALAFALLGLAGAACTPGQSAGQQPDAGAGGGSGGTGTGATGSGSSASSSSGTGSGSSTSSSSGTGGASSTSSSSGTGGASSTSSSSGTGGASSTSSSSGTGGACANACTAGATECAGTEVRTCAEQPGGCTAWGPATDCQTGYTCSGTQCVPVPVSCTIGGQTYAAGSIEAGMPCQVCDPALSATAWSPAPDGQGCGPGSVCAAGACADPPATACDVHVPGDYATLQAAISGLRAGNQAATVCVAAGTYTESLIVDYSTAPLTVVGVSAAKVILQGSISDPPPASFSPNAAAITFQNMTITGSVKASQSLSLQACVVQLGVVLEMPTTNSYASSPPITYLIDSSDITCGNCTAVGIGFLDPNDYEQPVNLTVQNSYVHDSSWGLTVDCPTAPTTYVCDATVSLINNTFANDGTAISLYLYEPQDVTTEIADNFITGATNAVDTKRPPQVLDDFRDNALFGNVNNYLDDAAPGAGYVTSNPLVLATKPPTPTAGSPLIGAGDTSLVTTNDFFGRPRNGRADIGAVEGP